MNIKKSLFAALLATVSLGAMAQEAKTEYVSDPHWYIQLQAGGQYTLGEIDFGKLCSPTAQVAVGYNFGKVVGARLAVSAWQSKAGSKIRGTEYKWKWNYVAPGIDVTFNLSNLISGVNPNRLVDVTAFIGGGVNIAWNNKEAVAANEAMYAMYGTPAAGTLGESQYLRKLWDGTKARGFGRAGLAADFKVSKRVNVGVEVNATATTDAYNSKKASDADWYFNALAGVKIALGKTSHEVTIPAPEPQVIYKERIVEKIVEKPVEVAAPAVAKDPLRIDVFFTIASTKLVGSEAQKVNEIANYLNKYPNSKVTITGYADKGTGNAKINKGLSEKRADIVKNELIKKYNIAVDRIITDSKGDTVQPFDVEVLNRVSICIAE